MKLFEGCRQGGWRSNLEQFVFLIFLSVIVIVEFIVINWSCWKCWGGEILNCKLDRVEEGLKKRYFFKSWGILNKEP